MGQSSEQELGQRLVQSEPKTWIGRGEILQPSKLELVERPVRRSVELLPLRSEPEAPARAALEQGLPIGDGVFERAQVLAHHRPHEAKVLRGRLERADLDGSHERLEPGEMPRKLSTRHGPRIPWRGTHGSAAWGVVARRLR